MLNSIVTLLLTVIGVYAVSSAPSVTGLMHAKDVRDVAFLPGDPNNVQNLLLNAAGRNRSEEHTSELQSHSDLVCRLLLEKKNYNTDSSEAHQRHPNRLLPIPTPTSPQPTNPPQKTNRPPSPSRRRLSQLPSLITC